MTAIDPVSLIHERDAEARRAAQTVFDRPLVIEAGAGTGKTRTLVARVVVWCLGPGWSRAAAALRPSRLETEPVAAPERIATRVLRRLVAVTFTEAAAAEMAERIAESLRRIAIGEPVIGVHEDLLPQDPDERRERARALVGALHHLVVRTIHAFCRRLLAAYPIEAGLDPSFQVDAEGVQQVRIVREVIEARLREAYASPGDPGFLSLAEHEQGPMEIEAAVRALLQRAVTPGDLEEDPFSAPRLAAFAEKTTELARSILSRRGGAVGQPARITKTSSEMLRILEVTEARLGGGPWHDTRALLACRDELASLWAEKYLKRLRDWGKGDFKVTDAKALGSCCEELVAPSAALALRLAHLLDLDPERLALARQVVQPLLAEVYRQLRRQGVETFAMLLHDAFALLRDHPDTARQVRAGIDQLLVDEFQDTDALQCGIVRYLALLGDPQERPGLFLVGDPKQSIYGWRSADLRAFDGFVTEVCEAGGEVHHLGVSFRSLPAILEEVERVIRPVMQGRVGVQPEFQPLVACSELAHATGFQGGGRRTIEYWVSSYKPSDEGSAALERRGEDETIHPTVVSAAGANVVEAQALAVDLLGLHEEHGVPWSDIAVLLRGMGDVETYLAALREAGVPFLVEHDRGYYQRREVIEAWALVQCLLEPSDHIALVAWLRSATVGVPDAALLPLWAAGLPGYLTELTTDDDKVLATIDALVTEVHKQMPVQAPGLERLPEWDLHLRAALRQLARLRRAFREDPADDIVERLRTTLLPEATEAARYLGRYRLANLERFYGRLLSALETHGGDAHAVLRALRLSIEDAQEAEEARPKEVGEDGVRISTIHQAKGLDFRHVYVLQMHKGPPPAEKRANDAGGNGGELQYRLLGAATLGFFEVEKQRQEVEAAERVRTLYVAMTRAKERLVLAGHWERASGGMPRSYVDLLRQRALPSPDMPALWQQALLRDGEPIVQAGAAWLFPALRGRGRTSVRQARRPELTANQIAAIAADSARLQRLREDAENRARRPLGAAISDEVHKDWFERVAAPLEAGGAEAAVESSLAGHDGESLGRAVALAAGALVHKALEALDLAAELEAAWEGEMQRLDTVAIPGIAATARPAVLERAIRVMRRFREGPLWRRFVSVCPHILARELAVVLPVAAVDVDSGRSRGTQEGGPVTYLSGAVDMVYRDPLDGGIVVIDYKTDMVQSESDLEALAQTYAPQVALYARAVRDALGLDELPRTQLWFLDVGVVR